MSSTTTLQTNSLIYKSVIGTGASSLVFKAFDKRTGEYRAAKVIKERSKYNLLDLNREITSLRNLSHPNIVKLYGKETEIGSKRDVLILEYCQTSLYSFLQEPANVHGLRDEEFLTLFVDIASGIQYLHSNGIVHRDLKPGNILRNIKPDLSPIYVISDFGTSRKLENPEDEYLSLVGTEEFLHPAVYQKAFIDKTQVTPFNSGTDLWSFGCTLFQAISSRMPFIPVDGARSNRTIMFKMVALKPSGCISAYQNSPGGDIIWEDRFPQNCPMSSKLKEIMRTILSSLMEADARKQITYENLFRTKKRLSTMFRLEVHLSSDGTIQTLYLDPTQSFAELQEEIAKYTDISAGRQMLIYNDQILENLIQKDLCLVQLFHQPPSINPLTLVVNNKEQNLAPYSIEPFPVYHNTNTVNTDYQLTSKRCEIVNNIMILVSQSLSFQLNITKTISAMWTMLKTMFLKDEKNYECLKELQTQTLFQVQNLKMIYGEKKYGFFFKKHKKRNKEDDELEDLLDEVKSKFKPVLDCIVDLNNNCQTFLHNSQKNYDMCTSDCSKKISNYYNKMIELLGCMKKRKNKEILIEMENTEHLHDRCESEEVCAASLALWQDHCWNNKKKSFGRFQSLKRLFFESKEKAKNGNKLMVELRRLCNMIRHRCAKVYHDMWSATSTIHLNDLSEQLDLDDETGPMKDDENPEPKEVSSNMGYHYQRHFGEFYNADNDARVPSRDRGLVRAKSFTAQDKRNISSRARLHAVSDFSTIHNRLSNGHGNGAKPMDISQY